MVGVKEGRDVGACVGLLVGNLVGIVEGFRDGLTNKSRVSCTFMYAMSHESLVPSQTEYLLDR